MIHQILAIFKINDLWGSIYPLFNPLHLPQLYIYIYIYCLKVFITCSMMYYNLPLIYHLKCFINVIMYNYTIIT